MTPERWQQIEELFHSALERAENERPAFLTAACEGNTELRAQVEALLTSFTKAGDFIEASPVERALAFSAHEPDLNPGSTQRLLIGRRLGHYEVQLLLGTGGTGEVYLARDLKLERQVALKILSVQFPRDETQVRRFECEARAASALNHPNIIVIYEIGSQTEQSEHTHFIATEFVPGQTLREKIAGGKVSLPEALGITIQISDALAAAHQAGIAHRDIKPENVMVRPDGLVKVLDFGLAKLEARESSAPTSGPPAMGRIAAMQTDPGMLVGTLAYLSPEQVRRQEVDHHTDIFSLGIVLYELVTGSRPFTRDSAAAVCDAILSDRPILPSGMPQGLQRIINRALEKERTARYQTAEEMRNDLQQLVHEANGTWPSGASEWRIKAALTLSALMILAALLLSLSLRRTDRPVSSPFSAGSVKRITDAPGEEIFPSLSPDGRTIVYASRATGNWDIYLQEVGKPQAVNLTADSPDVELAPAFSSDGALIAFHSSREGGGVYLMDLNGRLLKRVSPDGYNPAWSPDGREIVMAEDRIFDFEGRNHSHSRLFAVNVQTKARRLITSRDAVQPSWSPRGHRIAYWGIHKGGQRDIWTVGAFGGEPMAVTNDRAVDWNPVWARDGRHLYFLSDRGGSMNLWRVPIDELSGRAGPAEPATLPAVNSQHLSFSADGRTLVYVEMNRRENTYQVAFDPVAAKIIGQPTPVTDGARRHNSPEMAPDEKSLVFVSAGEAQEDVFVIDRDSAQPRQLTRDSALNRVPRWSPDGRHIAFVSDQSGKYEIWQVNLDGSELKQLTDVPDANVMNPVWSPDGRRLLYHVSGNNSFTIEIDQPRDAQTPRPLVGQQSPDFLPWSWSPDGTMLAGWLFDPGRASGIMVYSFATASYKLMTTRGWNPIWLNDNRRLLFADVGKLYLLDTLTSQWGEIYSVEPDQIRPCTLSQDHSRLYYSRFTSEANVWLLPLN